MIHASTATTHPVFSAFVSMAGLATIFPRVGTATGLEAVAESMRLYIEDLRPANIKGYAKVIAKPVANRAAVARRSSVRWKLFKMRG